MKLAEFLERASLQGLRRNGNGYMARCPAHDDRAASLSVAEGDDERVLLHCHAGCALGTITTALGLTTSDLFNGNGKSAKPEIVATYDYVTDDGNLLYQVVRYEPKGFKQRRPDGSGGWVWKLGDTPRVLYRLPDVLTAVMCGDTVFVVEGEKDADAIVAAGAWATCNAGGAGKWRDEYSRALDGANVIIVVDKDDAGRKHAAQVKVALAGHAASCRVVEPAIGKDAADHLAAGQGLADFEPVRGGDAAAALPIYSVAELEAMDIPRPEFVVDVPLALARGTVAELDAYPKHGKTRLVLDAVWSVLSERPFLGAPTRKVNVLYLTEEWLVTWRDALTEAQLTGGEGSGLYWMSLIDLQGKECGDWQELCEQLRSYCLAKEIGLLVVDTLARWAGVADENDAVAMAAAVLPLRLIAAENVAVLFLRHDRKGGGELGQSGRGSSATTGEADHVVHLQRRGGQGEATLRQRELDGVGRLVGMTGKLVIELGDGGHFELIGSKSDVALSRAKELILGALPTRQEEAWTVKELMGRFQGSRATMDRALNDLYHEAKVDHEKGAGHAAASRGLKALGYWRLSAPEQKSFELEES